MSDELDALDDAKLSEVFAVEVAGMEKRTEGMLWDESKSRAYIIGGSALHDIRKRMRLPDGKGLVADFATDANAVLPWLDKYKDWSLQRFENCVRGNLYRCYFGNKIAQGGFADAPARAACIALIRAKRASK